MGHFNNGVGHFNKGYMVGHFNKGYMVWDISIRDGGTFQ